MTALPPRPQRSCRCRTRLRPLRAHTRAAVEPGCALATEVRAGKAYVRCGEAPWPLPRVHVRRNSRIAAWEVESPQNPIGMAPSLSPVALIGDYMRNLWLVLFGGRRNERETKRGKGRRMMSREGVVCGGEKKNDSIRL